MGCQLGATGGKEVDLFMFNCSAKMKRLALPAAIKTVNGMGETTKGLSCRQPVTLNENYLIISNIPSFSMIIIP